MKVTEFSSQIKKWYIKDKTILSQFTEPIFDYKFNMDSHDIDSIYFYITIQKKMEQSNAIEPLFYYESDMDFKILNNGEAPSPEFLFSIVDFATFEYVKHYLRKTKSTNLQYTRAEQKYFNLLQPQLISTINNWSLSFKSKETFRI